MIGKYLVYTPGNRYKKDQILTDNPREAVWEANRIPGRMIKNICGEKQFYQDEGRWRTKREV